MMPGAVRIGGLVALVVVFSAAAASAQEAAGETTQLRWSLEGTAGVQLGYTGTIQSLAFGFAPTRSLTLLIGAERSRTEDEIEFFPDGYASERGGVVEFVSAELRYALFATKRASPYAVVGFGRGLERPNVNELFPHGVDRKIAVLYYGGGARIPIHRRLDALADWRLIVMGDDAAEMAVLGSPACRHRLPVLTRSQCRSRTLSQFPLHQRWETQTVANHCHPNVFRDRRETCAAQPDYVHRAQQLMPMMDERRNMFVRAAFGG